ncbi:hypothetical protein BWI96_05475 [Siphonobacter sp. SORGH_AS_0500]|nr:hypothetical protein BWI96_05475 [Siphonobacter sp. SORGH_AS_0500]
MINPLTDSFRLANPKKQRVNEINKIKPQRGYEEKITCLPFIPKDCHLERRERPFLALGRVTSLVKFVAFVGSFASFWLTDLIININPPIACLNPRKDQRKVYFILPQNFILD